MNRTNNLAAGGHRFISPALVFSTIIFGAYTTQSFGGPVVEAEKEGRERVEDVRKGGKTELERTLEDIDKSAGKTSERNTKNLNSAAEAARIHTAKSSEHWKSKMQETVSSGGTSAQGASHESATVVKARNGFGKPVDVESAKSNTEPADSLAQGKRRRFEAERVVTESKLTEAQKLVVEELAKMMDDEGKDQPELKASLDKMLADGKLTAEYALNGLEYANRLYEAAVASAKNTLKDPAHLELVGAIEAKIVEVRELEKELKKAVNTHATDKIKELVGQIATKRKNAKAAQEALESKLMETAEGRALHAEMQNDYLKRVDTLSAEIAERFNKDAKEKITKEEVKNKLLCDCGAVFMMGMPSFIASLGQMCKMGGRGRHA